MFSCRSSGPAWACSTPCCACFPTPRWACNEETAEPVPYYAKVPPAKGDELAIAIDPMFATGGSAVDAVSQLKKLGYRRIIFLNLVSAPEGIANFEKQHPDVPVYTAAKDERLNSHFYIVPGLGDAGDRIFGTL